MFMGFDLKSKMYPLFILGLKLKEIEKKKEESIILVNPYVVYLYINK